MSFFRNLLVFAKIRGILKWTNDRVALFSIAVDSVHSCEHSYQFLGDRL